MTTKTHIVENTSANIDLAREKSLPIKMMCGEEKVPLGEGFDPTLPFCLPCIHIHNDRLSRPTWTYTIYKS